MVLSDLFCGQEAKIAALQTKIPALRQRLMAMGFLPGMPVQVKRVAYFGGPMQIRSCLGLYSISRMDASLLEVAL